MNDLVLTAKTMTSTQLAEITGISKSNINKKIKIMFQEEIEHGLVASSIDARGYITDYHLPLSMALMFMAKKYNDVMFKIINSLVITNESIIDILEAIKNIDLDDVPPEFFVYVAREEHSKRIKVGISKDPERRIKELNVGNPEVLTIIAGFRANNGFESEKAAHLELADSQIRGEWFCSDADYMKIKDVV